MRLEKIPFVYTFRHTPDTPKIQGRSKMYIIDALFFKYKHISSAEKSDGVIHLLSEMLMICDRKKGVSPVNVTAGSIR